MHKILLNMVQPTRYFLTYPRHANCLVLAGPLLNGVDMKTCRKCGVKKELAEYYKHKQMLDGHLNICKSCKKNDVNKHRDENLERIQAYDRNRPNNQDRLEINKRYRKTAAGKASIKRAMIKYETNNKIKSQARGKVMNALKYGRMIKQNCVVCNDPAEAHHEDYSKPLKVIWYCDKHHKARHKQLNQIRRENLVQSPLS